MDENASRRACGFVISCFNNIFPALKDAINTTVSCCVPSEETDGALIKFKTDNLRQQVSMILKSLRSRFLSACESLSSYGTNVQAIKEGIAQRKIQALTNFIHVCARRINDVMECCIECCTAIRTIKAKMEALLKEYEGLKKSQQKSSMSGNIAYAVGGVGLAGLVGAGAVALAPIAVPAATLGTIATLSGVMGGGGMVTGYCLKYGEEEKKRIITKAINDVITFNKCLDPSCMTSRSDMAVHVAKNMESVDLIKIVWSNTPNVMDYESKCVLVEAADDETLMKMLEKRAATVSYINEFKTEMEKLKEETEKAKKLVEEKLEVLEVYDRS